MPNDTPILMTSSGSYLITARGGYLIYAYTPTDNTQEKVRCRVSQPIVEVEITTPKAKVSVKQ
jgi:hypothetical protein